MGAVAHPNLTMAGLRDREQNLRDALDVVIARRRFSRAELVRFQTDSLKALLKYAFERVPFYREKYKSAGFHPRNFQSLADLGRIPFVTKEDFRQASVESLIAENYPAQARLLSSSGSTGVPSRLFRDEDSLWHFTAYDVALYHDWCRKKPLTSGLYVLDLEPGGIDAALADHLRTTVSDESILPVTTRIPDILRAFLDFRPEFVSTYPSTIRAIALELILRRQVDSHIKLIHTTSEMLDARTKELLSTVFPSARVVETYTSTEGGLIAFTCASQGAWHFAEDAGIYETVDERGEPTVDLGDLVVTNLTNWATPVIRYRGLGDSCLLKPGRCACGSMLQMVERFEGRRAENIVLPNGAHLTPYALTNLIEQVDGVQQFQIVQPSRESLIVNAVLAESGSSESVRATLLEKLQGTIPAAVAIELNFVPRIDPPAASHKTPLVISQVRDG